MRYTWGNMSRFHTRYILYTSTYTVTFTVLMTFISSNQCCQATASKWLQVLFRSYVNIIGPLFIVIDCEPLHDPNNRSVGFTISRFIEPSSLQPPHRGEHAKGVRGEEGEWEGGEGSEKRWVNLNEWEWVRGKGGGARGREGEWEEGLNGKVGWGKWKKGRSERKGMVKGVREGSEREEVRGRKSEGGEWKEGEWWGVNERRRGMN